MRDYLRPFLAGFVITALILVAVEAHAQEAPTRTNEFHGKIAGGLATVPDYESAKP